MELVLKRDRQGEKREGDRPLRGAVCASAQIHPRTPVPGSDHGGRAGFQGARDTRYVQRGLGVKAFVLPVASA